MHFPDLEVCCDWSTFFSAQVSFGEMCVLEGFHLFKMCLYIMDNFFVESCAYVYDRV